MKSNKKYIIFMLLGLSIPLFTIFWGEIVFVSNTKTCAKVLRSEKTRGYRYFVLGYYVQGKYYTSNVSSAYFSIKDLNKLKKYPCIHIKHSDSFPSYVKLIDSKVGK